MNKRQALSTLDKLPAIDTLKEKGKEISIISDLPKDIKESIDLYGKSLKQAKEKSVIADIQKKGILDHVNDLQDKYASHGVFNKSLRLQGMKSVVTFTRPDKFNVASGVTIKDIEKAAGKEFAKENFSVARTLQVNPEVMEDPASLKELVSILSSAFGDRLGDFFVQEKKVIPQKGLDVAQYQLEDGARRKLLELMSQTAASLKA